MNIGEIIVVSEFEEIEDPTPVVEEQEIPQVEEEVVAIGV